MANNPYVNKVQYGNQVVMDLTNDTVTPSSVAQGVTFHDRSGASQVGTMSVPSIVPTPSSSVDEDDVVTAINGAVLQDGGENGDIASLFGVASWSNTMTKTILVQGTATNSPIGTTGIGQWQDTLDNPTKAQEQGWGWIEIPELHGFGTNNNVGIRLLYDPAKSGAIALGGYIIDDVTDMMCIRFANEISQEDTATAVIGIEITYKRTETRILGA